MTRVAIVGSRHADSAAVFDALCRDFRIGGCDIVTGDAPGADEGARRYAEQMHRPLTVHVAKWEEHGKRAGPIRNSEIVADCDWVIAFWDLRSRGTKDTIDKALRAGKVVTIVPLLSISSDEGAA